MLKSLLTTTAVAALIIGAAQAQETEAEDPAATEIQAESPVEEAGDEAGQALEEGAEATGDAAEQAGDTAQETAEETGDAMDEAADDVASDEQDGTVMEGDTETMGAESDMMEGDTETMGAESDMMEGDAETAAGSGGDFGQPAEGWTPVDASTLSADNLIGAQIANLEEDQVATVGDVLLAADGQVESIVAEFGGFLGFGENTVLLSMEEIDFIKSGDDEIVVRTTLSPEELEARPEYEADETAVEG